MSGMSTQPRAKTTPASNRSSYSHKTQSAPEIDPLGADLSAADPKVIDDRLSDLYSDWFGMAGARDRAQERLELLETYEEEHGRVLWSEKPRERENLAKEIARWDEVILENLRAQEVLDTEFRRRGRWTRAFLVSGGHLHSSMECSTCFTTTRFSWMTQFSNEDETSIVEAAGERACTVCYPSAPVDVLRRKSTLLTPDEEDAARARGEREAAKIERDRVKAEKAITNPDGTPLRAPGRYGGEVKTLVTAERELTDKLADIAVVELRTAEGNAPNNPNYVVDLREFADRLVAAIAHKKGITENEVREVAGPKAQKKLKSWGYV